MFPTKTIGALSTALLLAATAPAAADVTLINVFEVPEGQLQEAITAWEKARDFLSQEPGYISTALHQSTASDARFALINVAQWESPDAFFKATQRMRDQKIFPQIEGLKINPALYQVIRTDTPQSDKADQ